MNIYIRTNAPVIHFRDAESHVHIHGFKEEEHPRGQPENAGQFVEAGGGASKPVNQEKFIKNHPGLTDRDRRDLDAWVSEEPFEYNKLRSSRDFAEMIKTRLPQYNGPALRATILPRAQAIQLKKLVGKTYRFDKNSPIAIGKSTPKDVVFFTKWRDPSTTSAVIFYIDGVRAGDVGYDEADGLHEGILPMGSKFKVEAVKLISSTPDIPQHFQVTLKG